MHKAISHSDLSKTLPFHSVFIRDLHLNDAVNTKLVPMIVEADEIVCIVIPEHDKRGDPVIYLVLKDISSRKSLTVL